MRNTLLIVRRELAAYARTPSGYVIAACVLLVNGLLFNTRAVGSTPRLSTEVLQQFLIDAGGTTMLAAVLFSMRLLAEERAAGTQVLLFTSPIREGEIVLVPFGGSGRTLAVAKKPARRYIGFELSKEYARMIEERLSTIHAGDPLIGPENATKSAPATSKGRRLQRPTGSAAKPATEGQPRLFGT